MPVHEYYEYSCKLSDLLRSHPIHHALFLATPPSLAFFRYVLGRRNFLIPLASVTGQFVPHHVLPQQHITRESPCRNFLNQSDFQDLYEDLLRDDRALRINLQKDRITWKILPSMTTIESIETIAGRICGDLSSFDTGSFKVIPYSSEVLFQNYHPPSRQLEELQLRMGRFIVQYITDMLTLSVSHHLENYLTLTGKKTPFDVAQSDCRNLRQLATVAKDVKNDVKINDEEPCDTSSPLITTTSATTTSYTLPSEVLLLISRQYSCLQLSTNNAVWVSLNRYICMYVYLSVCLSVCPSV